MSVKLLIEHSLKGGCTGSSESTQNATLLEITCHGSNVYHGETMQNISIGTYRICANASRKRPC